MAAQFEKQAGTSAPTYQFGIGIISMLVKWTASRILFRNKADSNYVGASLSVVDYFDSAGTNKVTVGFPTGAGADRTINLPTGAPTAGFALVTDGAGNLSYAAAGNTAANLANDITTLAFGTASPVAMFTLPALGVIDEIMIIVDTAFSGTPTLSIGITGTLSKYVGTGDLDLTVVGTYRVPLDVIPVAGTEAMIATYSAGGAAAGAARIFVKYTPTPS